MAGVVVVGNRNQTGESVGLREDGLLFTIDRLAGESHRRRECPLSRGQEALRAHPHACNPAEG